MPNVENKDQQLINFAGEHDLGVEMLHQLITDVCTDLTGLGIEELNWFPPEELPQIVVDYGLSSDKVSDYLRGKHEDIGGSEHIALVTLEEYIDRRFNRYRKGKVEYDHTSSKVIEVDVIQQPLSNDVNVIISKFISNDETRAEIILNNGTPIKRSISLKSDPGTTLFRRMESPSYSPKIHDLQVHKEEIIKQYPQTEFIHITQAFGINHTARRLAIT